MEVITTHINADFDTLASVIAAKKLYPEAVIVFPGSMERAVRDFLDEYSVPGFSHKKIKQINMEEVERLILVDTRQKGRIGPFADIIGRKGLDVHIYDHHPAADDDIEGSLEITKPCGSTTTIMIDLLRDKGIDITPEEATVMMLGIYEDTGFLSFVSTTEEDFLAAAWLRAKGADLKTVSDMIRREMTAEEVSLLNDMNDNARTHVINGLEIMITKASSEKYIGDAAALVHKVMDVNRIDALFALIRMEKKIYLVARSRSKDIDAGEVAVAMGGGGHPTAASATIRDITLIEAEEKLFKILEENVQGVRCAGDIMSSPVKSIEAGRDLVYAKNIMAKMNINVLPVLKRGKLVGLISRQDIGRALHHGLEKHKVEEFMLADYSTVKKNVPLSEVQELIVERNQKFLPVIKEGIVVGCITRTDILRILHDESRKGEAFLERGAHKKRMKGVISGRLPKWMQEILAKCTVQADEMTLKAYLVGGFVRDLVMGNENLDIDIVVEGDGIAYAEGLAEVFGGRCKSHKKFGTAVVVLPDGFKIDVASARMEFYETPAALPTVEAASIKKDLQRRDFTINAMAVRLNSKGFGELIDFFGGLRDIKDKAIRVLHSLSFVEDPTRAFRAIRFEERLGFHLGRQSLDLIKNAAKRNFFDKVSPARIFSELKIILAGDNPFTAIKRMDDLGIIKFIHPEIKAGKDTEKLFLELQKVFDWYDLLFKEEECLRWIVLFAALQLPLETKEVEEMVRSIGLASKDGERLIEIKSMGGKLIDALGGEVDDCKLYKLLCPLKLETLLFIMAMATKSRVKEKISRYITELKDITVETKGKDIEAIGIAPSPLYGRIKEDLLSERLKGTLKSKKDELAYIKNHWIDRPEKG